MPMPDPLLITGPPDDLQATVELENTTDHRISLRGVVLRRKGEDDLAARFGAILPPDSTTRVPVQLSVPVTTAPGDYSAQLEIGGQSRTATLRVEAKISARVIPDHVLAEPGRTKVQLRLVNQGNVAIPLARTTRGQTGDDDDDPEVSLVLTASAVLGAGETREVTGTLTVPDGLDPARRHEALVPVGVCDLRVTVLPRDPEKPVRASDRGTTTRTTKRRTAQPRTTEPRRPRQERS
jgi:hypothetical protein